MTGADAAIISNNNNDDEEDNEKEEEDGDDGNEEDVDDGNEEEEDEEDDDDEDDIMRDLPRAMVKRVEKLQELHKQQEQIMEKYLEERAKLEQKYRSLCHPLYTERAKIIAGEKDEEIAGSDELKKNDDDEIAKGIPQFWVCAMGHNENIAELLTEDDVDCLEHLSDIQCHDYADGRGFVLELHFSSDNPYFSNSVLTKRYDVPNILLADEPLLKNVEGCTIDWSGPEHCLTYRDVTKKQRGRGKHAGQVRTVTKREHKDSFFHFFDPPRLPSTMDEMDEAEAERLEEAFDADYDVAQAFRHNLCPKAVAWFTGQAMDEIIEEFQDEVENNNNNDRST